MSYISTCLADGAVGLWVLGESAFTAAVDQAGNSNGTYLNTGGITLGQTGIPGGNGATAAKFTPGTGNVDIPDVPAQEVGNNMTLELWVKFAHGNGTICMISTGTSGSWMFEADTNGLLYAEKVSVGVLAPSTSAVPDDGGLHQLAWARAGGGSDELYIDGADVTGVVTSDSLIACSGISIGVKRINNSDYFNGTEQFVAIYPSKLSPAVIANHFTLGSTAPVAPVVAVPGPAPLLGRMGR